ncbi:CHAP domain-containing protein [Aeromicrobium sp.]|uniref:CHAP domain-containing protein n=1 Tax=Aeromicrobium sp. TaxID=1871063 RepID=UPI0040349A7E
MSQSRVLTALISFAASLAVVGGLIVSAGVSAQAGSSLLCSGYASCKRAGYDHFGYETKQRTSYWRMYTGTNCTNYVAYRLITTNGMPNVRPKSGVGNARDWGKAMASVTDQTPTVGSVAWWGRTGNHVAYVEKVASPTEIIVSESNWGRTFDHRRITKSGSGWPDGFIHFADPDTTPEFSSTSRPTFSGPERVDGLLTATTASWTPAARLTYQWFADGTAIHGAVGPTHRLRPEDVGKKIHVRVTGTRAGYPTKTLTSAATTAAIAPGVLSAYRPTIEGEEAVGSVLQALTPAWSPDADMTYRWYADGERIVGANDRTFTLAPEQLGRSVVVHAVGKRPGYTTRALASAVATGAVREGRFATTPGPVVRGAPHVGSVLTASTPAWSPTADLHYQWYADDRPLAGATSPTYTIAPEDQGRRISVGVTGVRPGYVPSTIHGASATAPVQSGRFTSTFRPEISGAERVGAPLTATTHPWSPEAVLSYRWYADRTLLRGATSATFVPTPAHRGQRIHVVVTGRRPGFATASTVSARRTAPLAAGTFARATPPDFTGREKVGATLRATTEPWSPKATLTYRWYADGRAIAGATRASFVLTSKQLGQRVRVIVTGKAPGYSTKARWSTRLTAPVTR